MTDIRFDLSSVRKYNVLYNIGECERHGGLEHPTHPKKCCNSLCNDYCGAVNCHEHCKGAAFCCASSITSNVCNAQINGWPVTGQRAPCTLGNNSIK